MVNLLIAACAFILATGFAWHLKAVEQGVSLLHNTRLAYLVDPETATGTICAQPQSDNNCRLTIEIRQNSNWKNICPQSSNPMFSTERFYRITLVCLPPGLTMMKSIPFEISTMLKR